jgi:CRISPR-associated protein Cmr2
MSHVLIVTLGPVQDFIAAARRTRDLWFGSWLLSALSKAAAAAMAEECGLESLVFPGFSDPKALEIRNWTSAANKIVVRVPDGKDPADVARRGWKGLHQALERIRDEAFDRITGPYFIRPRAEQQVEDLIEYAWVSAREREDGYRKARERAEALLAARKNTRLWGRVTWGDEVPKSSIDGERESVLHEDLFDRILNRELSPEEARQAYGVGSKERLCGVGLLKRHGRHPKNPETHHFLSTGHLAAWPIYKRVEGLQGDVELADLWARYLKVLRNGGVPVEDLVYVQPDGRRRCLLDPYDGSLLFENRLPELFEEVMDETKRKEGLRQAREALAKVLERVGVKTPLPYYAILVADGDRMGKAIERQEKVEDHRTLSRALDGFARNARTVVEKDNGGELIYSGGDDVLAFVPLHNAVKCARELAKDFQERLSDFPVNERGEEEKTPTLSAGIGISHFMEPLQRALKTARQAEKVAKRERDSLAVIVEKRSGPPVEVTGTWGTLDTELEDYVVMHQKEQVPDGAAYELRELARLLDRLPEKPADGASSEVRRNLDRLVRKEAVRILRRKEPERGAKKEIDAKILERLEERIATMPVREVANRLIVARLLAQAADEATVPKSEGEPK